MNTPALSAQGLHFQYAGGRGPALLDVTMALAPGEFLLVAGPSGCGKSTLVKCLNGLIPRSYRGSFSGRVDHPGPANVLDRRLRLHLSFCGRSGRPRRRLQPTRSALQIAFAMDMAFRYVPAMARELQTTIDAQRVRGYELDQVRGGPIRRSIRIAPIVVPVVLNAILGAEDIIDAMDLRCFGIGRRTWLRALAYGNLDRAALVLMALLFLITIAANLTGHLGTWFPPG